MKLGHGYLSEILLLFGPDRRRVPTLVGLFLASSVFELFGVGLVLPLVKVLVDPEATSTGLLGDIYTALGLGRFAFLLVLSACFVATFAAKAVFIALIQRSILTFSGRQLSRLMSSLVYAYQTRSYASHVQQESGKSLRTVVEATRTFYGSVSMPFLRLIAEGIVLLAILGFLAFIDVRVLVTLTLMFGLAGFAYVRLVRRTLQRDGAQVQEAQALLARDVQEGFQGLKETRVLGKHLDFYHRAKGSSRAFAQAQVRFGVLTMLPRYVLEVLLVGFFVLLCVSYEATGSSFSAELPTIGAFAVAGMRLVPSFSNIVNSVLGLRYGRHATHLLAVELERLEGMDLDADTTDGGDVPVQQQAAPAAPFRELTLENVSFAYSESRGFSLSNVGLTVKAGESIGIIGNSGAGKTTLVDLILGLLEPKEGAVLYNGEPLTDDEVLSAWRSHVAYLPQEVFLVSGTLAENITLREPTAPGTAERIRAAVEKAQLSELVSSLPEGLDTQVGERGVLLSGGQRQRLSLARAFYHGRGVLVLDEATSALDMATEREIVSEVRRLKGKSTLIVITHRLSMVEHCDRIYRLDGGNIAGQGTYSDVVGRADVGSHSQHAMVGSS